MPSPWSYSSVPAVPTIGSISPAGAPGLRTPMVPAPGSVRLNRKVAFLDRPAVVAADRDAVDLFDVVLADVGEDQVAGGAVEAEAVGVAKAVGVDLGHLACVLERVADRDPVLAVGAHRIGAAGRQAPGSPGRCAASCPAACSGSARCRPARCGSRRRRWRCRRRPGRGRGSRLVRRRPYRRCGCRRSCRRK